MRARGRLGRAGAWLILLAALGLSAWLVVPAAADPTFPALTGRVVDDAGLLSAADKADLTETLKALEDKTSDQLVVVTLPSLQGYSIEDYGYRLGRHWGIGTKKLDNGALLIVAPNERKVRIEVGYGLEPTLTDAMSSIIIDNAILPQFRKGDYAQGIKDGVRDIVKTLQGGGAEVTQQAKAREQQAEPVDWVTVLVWVLILLWVFYSFSRSARGVTGRRGYGGPIILPGPGWGGGGGGFGDGGGGFSGGGGSFGGGGASGSW